MKKVLVLGGTGAMGRYAVPELLRLGFHVDVIALNTLPAESEHVTYTVADAMDDNWLKDYLKDRHYDAILDYMNYKLPEFRSRVDFLLDNTNHYLFLSSCRVYADEEIPVREDSPRLLDVSKDQDYLARYETEYSLYKAMEEDLLINSGKKNWTIILPATTYSTGRSQLVTLEANVFVRRALQGKKVILPREAMDRPATLSWGGDVGVMIARLVCNEKAKGEKVIVASAEHHTWKEIEEIYKKLLPLECEWVDMETYLRAISPNEERYPYMKYQLIYARMFHRITDNSKVLALTGMKQEELMPLAEGLKLELSRVTADSFGVPAHTEKSMDEYFAGRDNG